MAALISVSIAPVLAPLVAQLEADRQTIEHQAEQRVSQAGTIGQQVTEIEALKASQAIQRRVRRPLCLWAVVWALLLAVILLVVVVGLPLAR